MDPLKFGTVGGDRQELLEMGDKQEMGDWIWNRGD